MTIECGHVPSIADAARLLGVEKTAIDRKFGVVAIDPDRQLYSVRVAADSLKEAPGSGEAYRGPFSDPKIAPMR